MAVQSRAIFISHSSKDEWFVTPFIDKILNLGMSIPRGKIFYTSNEDTGIKSGVDFRKAIQKNYKMHRRLFRLLLKIINKARFV